MSPENGELLLKSDVAGMNFEDTELTLGMPGEPRGVLESRAKSGTKRFFLESYDKDVSSVLKPSSKAQVVGWPPVRDSRKNAMKGGKFVKVAVDGAPYLRKVDLEGYESYQQLLSALEDMFSCITIRNYLKEGKIMNGGEYDPTYEDKDGDWMMVGDVPWKLFVESCKRLRLMKCSS